MHVEIPDEMIPYLGKAVPRRGFRAYIYHVDGKTRLVNSYDEFDALIHSEGWFASKEQAEEAALPKKPRKKSEE